MHEYSIVSALITQCEQLAEQNQATGISRVAIKVGALSGVEPTLVSTAFDTFREGSICEQAELEMTIAPLTLHCNSCNQTSTPEQRTIICNHCGSSQTQVTDGEELLLMQLELITA